MPFGGLTYVDPMPNVLEWRSRSEESICSREGWQVSDATICQSTFRCLANVAADSDETRRSVWTLVTNEADVTNVYLFVCVCAYGPCCL